MNSPTTRPVPEPLATESDQEYRVRLREWFDAVPSQDSPGMRQSAWEYLCSLQGIAPQVTFEDARQIVTDEVSELWPPDYGTFSVLPYGWEDDTYWRVQAGASEYLVDGDDDYAPLDGSVYLVGKATGELTELLFLGNSDQIRAMRPVGVHPAER